MMKNISRVLLLGLLAALVVQTVAVADTINAGVVAVESRRAAASVTTTNSNSLALTTKTDATYTTRANKSWIKFDLTDVYAAYPGLQGNIGGATLMLFNSSAEAVGSKIQVWGINDSTADNASWVGTTITWANAPANDTTSQTELDTSKATLLDGSLAGNSARFEPFKLGNQALVDFLNLDGTTNPEDGTDGAGIVQFALSCLASPSNQFDICSTNYADQVGTNPPWDVLHRVKPVLILSTIPEPATLAILGLGGLLLRRRFA
jgi:hypothetical protein